MEAKQAPGRGRAPPDHPAKKRTYGDRCGIARALDVVGDRWALLVIRELLLGPKRFTDLRIGLPHVTPDVLSQRLRELEADGVVRRAMLPPPAGAQVYELTDRGRALEPVILELGRWGSVAPFPAIEEAGIGVDALVVALKTLYRPGGADAHIELRLDGQRFDARIAGGTFEVARGAADTRDATIAADAGLLASVLWHDGDAAALVIEGDKRAAKRFLRAFPLP
ncbi:MAG: winged helix-turn-helix transcriptional regulator [Solirubrobacteraceae bacterium]